MNCWPRRWSVVGGDRSDIVSRSSINQIPPPRAEIVGRLAADDRELGPSGHRSPMSVFSSARSRLVLNDPHRPLSEETTTTHVVSPSCSSRSGWLNSVRAATSAEHLRQGVGPGPRLGDRLLGPAQLRRRDHLHGLGDLLRALDGLDPPDEIPGIRQGRPPGSP